MRILLAAVALAAIAVAPAAADPLDPTICPILMQLENHDVGVVVRPITVSPVGSTPGAEVWLVEFHPDGDVDVAGPFWDCPPYAT